MVLFVFQFHSVCNFLYAARCPAPRDLRVTVGDHNVTASWLRPRLVLSRYPLVYHLEYRTKSLLGRSPEKVQRVCLFTVGVSRAKFTYTARSYMLLVGSGILLTGQLLRFVI